MPLKPSQDTIEAMQSKHTIFTKDYLESLGIAEDQGEASQQLLSGDGIRVRLPTMKYEDIVWSSCGIASNITPIVRDEMVDIPPENFEVGRKRPYFSVPVSKEMLALASLPEACECSLASSIEIPAKDKVEVHKCHCPAENFRLDGVGCVCGGI